MREYDRFDDLKYELKQEGSLQDKFKLLWRERKYLFNNATEQSILQSFNAFGQFLKCKLRLCNECEHCETYVCWYCGERKPWSNGGTDGLECDDCWNEMSICH